MGESHYLKAAAAGLPAFPPGFVPRYEAAQMFGVALGTWQQWEKTGRVRIPRHRRKLTKGPPWVLYALCDLEKLREEFKKQEQARAEAAKVPEGFVTLERAAAMFRVALRTWSQWELEGRIPVQCDWVRTGKGPPYKVYAVADLLPLREEFSKPKTFSPGLVPRVEAARMFGVALRTWDEWERDGRIPLKRYSEKISRGGPWVLYAVEDLIPLREEFRRLKEPYPDPQRPGVYRVPLSGYTRHQEALIDAESLPLVQGRNWHWEEKTDGHLGCVALATDNGSNTPLKRVIMGVADAGPEMRVSHANRDPLDCRRSNLIVRTINEQMWATRKRGTVSGQVYTSKYKGVSWDEPRGKWKAQIQCDGRNRFIGRYDEEEDAALAYDQEARRHFGEHACLNFPSNDERAALPPTGRKGRRLAA